MPETVDTTPVAAVLEYIPYCKRDGTAARDEAMHPYFAGHGYAAIRVDMRGSGESDGGLLDEYLRQEQDDALEVIAWIAAQPWCDGKVGMMGKSWGGFNALQVAARRPPALKCIISVYSTDDRYADDVHYMGGCLLADNPGWAFTMFEHNTRPPDPALVGDSWRETWLERLRTNRPWIVDWLVHQTRDDYWKHGSVCESYVDIEVPVYAIGGWADAYSNTVPRLLSNLRCPRKGLVGPWGHQYMHEAIPGPMMGFPDEALRWWDYWLKGKPTGIMDEPQYRVWMQQSIAPETWYPRRPGRWVAEPSWPSARIQSRTFALNETGLCDQASKGEIQRVKCVQTLGTANIFWGDDGGGAAQQPGDQREDDARSLCFDSGALDTAIEILGAPTVTLALEVDRTTAFICVRLCDVAPDGASTRVSFGLLNLTHRHGHETPQLLEPGTCYEVRVKLNDIAHRFSAGHQIRISLSSALWPMVWPSNTPVTLGIHPGVSTLNLPIRPINPDDKKLTALPAPAMSATDPVTVRRPASIPSTRVHRDVTSGVTEIRQTIDDGCLYLERNGWCFGALTEIVQQIHEQDPLSARMTLQGVVTYAREDVCDIRVHLSHLVTADAACFYVQARMEAFDDDHPVFARSWLERIPRNGV